MPDSVPAESESRPHKNELVQAEATERKEKSGRATLTMQGQPSNSKEVDFGEAAEQFGMKTKAQNNFRTNKTHTWDYSRRHSPSAANEVAPKRKRDVEQLLENAAKWIVVNQFVQIGGNENTTIIWTLRRYILNWQHLEIPCRQSQGCFFE